MKIVADKAHHLEEEVRAAFHEFVKHEIDKFEEEAGLVLKEKKGKHYNPHSHHHHLGQNQHTESFLALLEASNLVEEALKVKKAVNKTSLKLVLMKVKKQQLVEQCLMNSARSYPDTITKTQFNYLQAVRQPQFSARGAEIGNVRFKSYSISNSVESVRSTIPSIKPEINTSFSVEEDNQENLESPTQAAKDHDASHCHYCGKKLRGQGSKFCVNCGKFQQVKNSIPPPLESLRALSETMKKNIAEHKPTPPKIQKRDSIFTSNPRGIRTKTKIVDVQLKMERNKILSLIYQKRVKKLNLALKRKEEFPTQKFNLALEAEIEENIKKEKELILEAKLRDSKMYVNFANRRRFSSFGVDSARDAGEERNKKKIHKTKAPQTQQKIEKQTTFQFKSKCHGTRDEMEYHQVKPEDETNLEEMVKVEERALLYER